MFGHYTTGPTRLRADGIIPEPGRFVNHAYQASAIPNLAFSDSKHMHRTKPRAVAVQVSHLWG